MRGGGGGFMAGGEGLPKEGPTMPAAAAAWATSKRLSNPTHAPPALTALAVRMYPPAEEKRALPNMVLGGFGRAQRLGPGVLWPRPRVKRNGRKRSRWRAVWLERARAPGAP